VKEQEFMKGDEHAPTDPGVVGGGDSVHRENASEIAQKVFDNLNLKGSALQGNQVVALFRVH
jgi:hypothetical protein